MRKFPVRLKHFSIPHHINSMTQNCFSALPLGVRRAAFFLREYLFPFGCSVCGASLFGAAESWNGLCDDCRAGVEFDLAESLAGKTCDYCGKPLVSEHGRCLSCRLDVAEPNQRALDRIRVLFPYMGKYRKLLSAYKFGKNLALGNFFAEKMLELLARGAFPVEANPGGSCSQISVVPVPPRPGRIRETGWDQVGYLARLLERKTGTAGGCSVSRCLRRLPSESQKELGRESRRTNLRGRIVPARRVPETALVIDDVMTTGSTLNACATALREGGAKTVFGLCLFYD